MHSLVSVTVSQILALIVWESILAVFVIQPAGTVPACCCRDLHALVQCATFKECLRGNSAAIINAYRNIQFDQLEEVLLTISFHDIETISRPAVTTDVKRHIARARYKAFRVLGLLQDRERDDAG